MEQTKIQWTDASVNFWTGCKKVSKGCEFCYMYRDKDRYGQDPKLVTRTKDETFKKALEWKNPKLIFTCSWSDFFIDEADAWREDAWDIIRQTPHHTWQILTKRPERIKQCLPADWGDGWDNVWLGVSIENQKYFYRSVTLSKIPAKTRFISAEPLIQELNLMPVEHPTLINDHFHWCIIGGESGNEEGPYKYRECKQEWIERIINDLKGSNVSVFVKQMGTWIAKENFFKDKHGGEWDEWPGHLKIRDFPNGYLSFADAAKPLISNQSAKKAIEKTIYNGAELIAMNVQSIPSLVDPIIPKIGLMSLIGTSDIGKSTLLLQLCTDIVLNNSFLGFPIKAKHKSAIFVSTEDDMNSISNRLQRLKGCNKDKIKNLRALFNSENLLKALEKELSQQKADVVVVDTFSDIYPGEMNQVNQVRSFMNDYFNLAMKHECLVIFNHHTGKHTEDKPPSKNNSIGSAGFEGKCRMVMELRPDYTDNSKRHLCIVKANYLGPEYKTESYELDFDQIKGFSKNGNRKDFNELSKPKLFKPFANKKIEKGIVERLHKKRRSARWIEAFMSRIGKPVSKSTIGVWTKHCPVP